jgi:2-iminobutanoate/2-iminopropanoate deaminase
MKDKVMTADAPVSPFFSQAVKGAGLIFVSGQSGLDPNTGQLAGPTIGEQTHQSLKNVKAILEAAGSSMEDRECHIHPAQSRGLCRHECCLGLMVS